MDNFMRKNKGAISIFLVIVLLPMLSVAAVFVDMSRLKLASAMAESAGDLTLNTALTNYDGEMKNLYGLFATSQDMDELMASLEDYYRDSIIAAGVDSAAADDYVGQIMDYLKTTTGDDDLMNIELTNFEVSSPDGGNLGNPAILKSQIVEFMKYRAPLSLGSGFLDALSSMKNLKKQTELVEEKNQFYEQHQDLLGVLEDTWWQLQQYQHKDADAIGATGFPTGSYLTDQGALLSVNAKKLSEGDFVNKTVKYLYRWSYFKNLLTGAGKLQYEIKEELVCPECDKANPTDKTACTGCGADLTVEGVKHQWKLTWQGTAEVVKPAYTEDKPADADDVLESLNAVLNAIDQVDSYTTGKNNRGYQAALTKNNADPAVRIWAVCVFNEENAKTSTYLRKVKALLECLVNLEAAVATCDAEELSKTKVVQIDGGNYKIETSAGGTPIKGYADGNLQHLSLEAGGYLDMFNKVVSLVNGHYSATSDTFEAAKKSVTETYETVRKQVSGYYQKLEEKIGNLSTAITLLNSVHTSLTDTNSAYYKELQEWKRSANNLSDNTMGKNDLVEIEELTSIVTAERVSELITRLTKAKTTLEGIRDEVAKYTFAGVALKDMKPLKNNQDLAGVIAMFANWDSRILEIVPTAESAYDTIIAEIEVTGVMGGTITDTWGESENSPDLTKQQRELYTWLYNNFYDKNAVYTEENKSESGSNSVEDGEAEKGKLQENLQKQADEQNPKEDRSTGTKPKRDIKQYLDPELKALPSTRWDDEQAAIAVGKIETDQEAMLIESNRDGDNILETILSLASNMGAELRDNLYVTEYIMKMFSYDTLEAETYVRENKAGAAAPKNLAFYTAGDDGKYEVNDKYAEYAAKVKTLTKNSINPNMNYLYGEEVEYILYGENGADGVYGTIFVLRFALNTVYAFTDAEINNVTLSAATALFGTPPLTPLIPFAKAAMTIGLAIAESAWDLVELRQGEAVPLMKNNQTWIMKPSGIVGEVKEKLTVEAKEFMYSTVEAGYQVLSEALAMTTEELQAMINAGGKEMENLAKAVMATVMDEVENEANKALQKVVELCTAQNQKLMLDTGFDVEDIEGSLKSTQERIDAVKEALQQWLAEQPQDDAVLYEAKKLAVEYLTEEGGKVIGEIIDSVAAQSAEEPSAYNILTEKLDSVKSTIMEKIEEVIVNGSSALSKEVEELKKELEDAARQGADKLKETLGKYIDDAVGKLPGKEGSDAAAQGGLVSSLLSWRYSDYLRVFVLVGMFANEELMLLRIADMIELNMQKKDNEYAVITTTETVTTSRFFGLIKKKEEKQVASVNTEAFSLSKSYTYLTIRADLAVKPLFMTLPFMAETVENQLTGTNWYTITYSGSQGY